MAGCQALEFIAGQRRKELIEQMATGYAQDWADYRERVGTVKGLDTALALCDEVEKELTERKR